MKKYSFPNGEWFEEPTDWIAFARDALNDKASYPYFGLNLTYGYGGPDKRLFDLYEALRGSGAETRLADGVLRVMETGSPRDRFKARLGPYDRAPRVVERIAQMVTNDRAKTVEAGLLELLLSRLFQIEGAESTARALLRDELTKPDSPDLGLVACEHDFDWFTTHLPPYRPCFDVSTWVFFEEVSVSHACWTRSRNATSTSNG